MKKLIFFIILGSLISGCQTTSDPNPIAINDKVKQLNLNIIYSGNLNGKNTGQQQKDGSYLTKISIAPQATMTELLNEFHQQTGLNKTHAFWGGVPPNRRKIDIPYHYRVNEQRVNENNENKSLADWNITNNATITIFIEGGGELD